MYFLVTSWEGRSICLAESRKFYKTEKEALEAGYKHRCRFRARIVAFRERRKA